MTEEEKQRLCSMMGDIERPKKSGCLAILLIPIVLSTLVLLSCQGNRFARRQLSFENAIDDYNNDDRSILIVIIVLLLSFGVLSVRD